MKKQTNYSGSVVPVNGGLFSKCCKSEIKELSLSKTDGSIDTLYYCDNCGDEQPGTYNAEDGYMVIYWADEEMRDMGESSVEGYYPTLEEALIKAKRLYTKQDFPAVEVAKDDEVLFHISNDYPDGEKYDR